MSECPLCWYQVKRTEQLHMRHTCSAMGEPFSRTSSLCCSSAILMLNREGSRLQRPSVWGPLYQSDWNASGCNTSCIRTRGDGLRSMIILCLHSDMLAYTCPPQRSAFTVLHYLGTLNNLSKLAMLQPAMSVVLPSPAPASGSLSAAYAAPCVSVTSSRSLYHFRVYQSTAYVRRTPTMIIRNRVNACKTKHRGVHMSWWMSLWGLGPIMKWVCRSGVGPDSYEMKQQWQSLHA